MFRNRFFSNYFSPLLRYISSLVAPRPRTPGEVTVSCFIEQAAIVEVSQTNESSVVIDLKAIAIAISQTVTPVQISQM